MKINIPNMQFNKFVFLKWPHQLILALFVMTFSLVWRTQLSTRAKAANIVSTKIPQLESAKFIASVIMGSSLVRYLLATYSIFCSLPWEQELLSAKPKDRDLLLINKAIDLASTPGRAKLLTPQQITPETVVIHRRGIIAQNMGKLQSAPIYTPNEVIQGADLHNMDFPAFWTGFIKVIDTLGIPHDLLGIVFAPENFNPVTGCNSTFGGPTENPGITPIPTTELKQASKDFLIKFIISVSNQDSFVLNDGYTLSYDSENLLPIENGLPLTRPTPMGQLESLTETGNDPFLSLVNKQIGEFNQQIPSAPKKRGRPPKSK